MFLFAGLRNLLTFVSPLEKEGCFLKDWELKNKFKKSENNT
jgi:hypothetical protein